MILTGLQHCHLRELNPHRGDGLQLDAKAADPLGHRGPLHHPGEWDIVLVNDSCKKEEVVEYKSNAKEIIFNLCQKNIMQNPLAPGNTQKEYTHYFGALLKKILNS